MSSPSSHGHTDLPAVDERLIAPGTRYEIDDGKLVYVPPSHEPHGTLHAALAGLLEAHAAIEFTVALDMLTRTSKIDDFAPDASLFPAARDPGTGGRQLEHLAFEIVSTESLGHAARKAAKLAARGVRRLFAIDVAKKRAFEWSCELGTWQILATTAWLEDAALAVPLPVAALVDAAVADDATVRAYRAKRHPEFLAEREEGRAEGREEGRRHGRIELLRRLLAARFEGTDPELETRIADASTDLLDKYIVRILTAATASAVFED